MKIERASEEFKPITITLETEDEARALMTAVGHMGHGGVLSARSFYLEVFDYLSLNGVQCYDVEGNLDIIKD